MTLIPRWRSIAASLMFVRPVVQDELSISTYVQTDSRFICSTDEKCLDILMFLLFLLHRQFDGIIVLLKIRL